jgi:hypothetical protein
MDQPDELEQQEPMSEAVASAWVDVIMSVHELSKAKETTEQRASHLGPGVAVGHGSTGGDLTSPDQEARP